MFYKYLHSFIIFSYKINFIIIKMSNDKSLTHQNSVTGRTNSMGVTSRKKFQNVQKLTSIVRQMEQQNSSRPAQPGQVLQLIKAKIKNSYNTLYQNYQVNKNVILKNIQQTEANDANENTMKQKLELVLKQKNKFDKLKSEIEDKQRKLKKMLDLRDQIKSASSGSKPLKQTLNDRLEIVRMLQQYKNVLNYESSVLTNMKKQRDLIKLNLKQRHDHMLSEQQIKKERTKKIKDASYTKKLLLSHIQQKIKEEDDCEIPLGLAEQLQKKLQQYEGKYIHENILIHEKKLSEQKAELQRSELEKQQQKIKKVKLAKQKQQKRQFDIAHNHYLIKQAEEEQIKRLCRVDTIAQIASGKLEEEQKNLMSIKSDIQFEIAELKKENNQIRSEIEVIITSLGEQNVEKQEESLLQIEKKLEDEEAQLRRIKQHANKKQSLLLEWESILHILFGKCDRTNMGSMLKKNLAKYEKLSLKQRLENATGETKQLKTTKHSQFNVNRKFTKIPHKSSSSQGSEYMDC